VRDSQKSPSFVITVIVIKREERGEGVIGGSSDVRRREGCGAGERMVNICD
jgi:hypothetical protein